MNSQRIKLLTRLMLIVVLGLVVSTAALAQDPQAQITNLSDGEMLSGLMTIRGTVNFPDFAKYDVFLSGAGDPIWVATGHGPVVDGNLFRLDTRRYPNGSYQFLIRTVRPDSNYDEVLGPTVTFDNGENYAGLPALPEVESSFLYTTPDKALLRIQNCAGEEFRVDFDSTASNRTATTETVPGRLEGYICPFVDLPLIPAEYRGGGQGLAQARSVPYTFLAEGGKVYLMTYYGPQAGADELVVREVPADDPQADTGMAPAEAAADPTATPAPTAAPTATPAAADTPTAEAEAEAVLPVSGNNPGDSNPLALIMLGLLVAGALFAGGVLALRRRQEHI